MDVGTPLAFGPVRTSSGSSPPMLGQNKEVTEENINELAKEAANQYLATLH